MATIEAATREDVGRIWELIAELAEYERLTHVVTGSAEQLEDHLFGPSPSVSGLVARHEGTVVGYALYFKTYSTFRTQPGVWLEDLYVTPSYRGGGVGKALLASLAQLVHENGWGRLEWSVLDWNEPAVGFYQRLGADVMPEWRICRLADDSLAAVAAQS